jgi:hypothetical protein
MPKRLIAFFVSLSLAWNVVILFASLTNAQWVLPRVSGGQYTSIPLYIRGLNFVVALFSLYLIYFVNNLVTSDGTWSQRSALIARAVTLAFGLSTLVNMISRSQLERWNALPALIIALGIFKLSRSPQKA